MNSQFPVRSATPSPLDEAPLSSVNEERIRRLVHTFYDAVRKDGLIGPIFLERIAPGRWPHHLERMCAFWSSLLLRSGRYHGQPLPPHLRPPNLSDAHFARWLGLFRVTAREVFDESDAKAVIAVAERIAQSFRFAIAIHRGEDSTRLPPLPVEASIGVSIDTSERLVISVAIRPAHPSRIAPHAP